MANWELRVERIGVQRATATKSRTYGKYDVCIDGVVVPGLSGYMCERLGPGDNSKPGNGKRIQAGSYPLWTQFGKYRSTGYANGTLSGENPMPAIALAATGKRSAILIHPAHPPKLYLSSVGCLNPTSAIGPDDPINFFDSRDRVIAMLDSLRQHAPEAFRHEVMSRIGTAKIQIIGEPMAEILPSEEAIVASSLAEAETPSLPISKSSAIKCAQWLMQNFGDQIKAATTNKAYGAKHLCAIVCQETAYKWVPWIGRHSVQTIVERAVYDASGDFPDTSRSAFPVNTNAFRVRYGDAFTNELIEEANKTRRMQGYGDKAWVYKGYGLFQYDLQHIQTDEKFFRNKEWRSFDTCLRKATMVLDKKLIAQKGVLWEAIRAYNGSGPRARAYRDNVKVFTEYCGTVTG
ncbi:hypothetical protein [Asticcacaulis machinosus]|uniref:Transglycosylase SLT domain-containing protein n=1 Tax=Asticcacaulis machinosus TaxID=2984211 RepID=A0ABT5HFY8_9CAUL|nr:hypothetical protein [Asticcacaulis machinosus]MDC7675141.1 hypothetical protein [Asticcacaulis machinosus]